MSKIQLRAEFVRQLDIKFDSNDCIVSYDGLVLNKYAMENINGVRAFYNYFVTSFAPRKNKGSQPVGDNVPVVAILTHSEGNNWLRPAANEVFNWGVSGDVNSWKPDLDALIKMQIEHDAKLENEKAISCAVCGGADCETQQVITNQQEIAAVLREDFKSDQQQAIKNKQSTRDNLVEFLSLDWRVIDAEGMANDLLARYRMEAV